MKFLANIAKCSRWSVTVAVAAAMCGSHPIQGQSSAAEAPRENLTNADIVRMIQAHLPEEVVLEKINRSATKLDSSVNALITLRSAGATDAELNAIVRSSQGGVRSDLTSQRPAAQGFRAPEDAELDPGAEERARKAQMLLERHSNELWLDDRTSLLWTRNHNGAKDLKWSEAVEYCRSLELAGLRGWRLPERNELSNLALSTKTEMAQKLFPMAFRGFTLLWTDTSESDDRAYAVGFELTEGRPRNAVGTPYKKKRSDFMHSICVRSSSEP